MLSEFIQQLRKDRGMTQQYVASQLGLSRPTYVQVEAGSRDLTIPEATKLAEILDISLDGLLREVREQDPKVILEPSRQEPEPGPGVSIRITEGDENKFKQVLLYVLQKVGAKPNIGETVVYKLLYFIDFDYYEKYEENLMGATYIRNHYGPTPLGFTEIIEKMKAENELIEVKDKYFNYPRKKYLPRVNPDLSILSGRELEHIDEVLARLSEKNATEISEYSHGDIPWLSRKDGETLSYESVFYRDERYSVRTDDDDPL